MTALTAATEATRDAARDEADELIELVLGKALYGALGRRPSGDIDLLVAREDLRGAIEVAGRLGYCAAAPTSAEAVPLLHVRLGHAADALPPLELHWRVHWYEARFSRELLFRSMEATSPGRPAPLAHELLERALLASVEVANRVVGLPRD